MQPSPRKHRRFAAQEGLALVEFAFVLPVLLLLLFGGIEISRYILITQRVEKAGYTLGDLVTQYTPQQIKNITSFTTVFDQLSPIMSPYNDLARQRVVITSVTKDPADHKIKIDWQKSGGGTLSNAATISVVDKMNAGDITLSSPPPHTVATFNATYNKLLMPGVSSTDNPSAMADGENMIVTEVFYEYEPFLQQMLKGLGFQIGESTIVRRTFFHPRNGDLNSLS